MSNSDISNLSASLQNLQLCQWQEINNLLNCYHQEQQALIQTSSITPQPITAQLVNPTVVETEAPPPTAPPSTAAVHILHNSQWLSVGSPVQLCTSGKNSKSGDMATVTSILSTRNLYA